VKYGPREDDRVGVDEGATSMVDEDFINHASPSSSEGESDHDGGSADGKSTRSHRSKKRQGKSSAGTTPRRSPKKPVTPPRKGTRSTGRKVDKTKLKMQLSESQPRQRQRQSRPEQQKSSPSVRSRSSRSAATPETPPRRKSRPHKPQPDEQQPLTPPPSSTETRKGASTRPSPRSA
jgi:hypothetical protein